MVDRHPGRTTRGGTDRAGPTPSLDSRARGSPRPTLPGPLAERTGGRLADPLPVLDGHTPRPPTGAGPLRVSERPGPRLRTGHRPRGRLLAITVRPPLASVGHCP